MMSEDEKLTFDIRDLSIQAGVNQRYHQHEVDRWWRWSTFVRSSVGLLTVGGVMLAIIAATSPSWWWTATSLSASVFAAFFAVVLNAFRFEEWEQQHRSFFERWSDLRADTDWLMEIATKKEKAVMFGRATERSHQICKGETQPDSQLLQSCYEDEMKSRGLPAPTV